MCAEGGVSRRLTPHSAQICGPVDCNGAGTPTRGGLSERPMEPVLKTGGQKCLVGSNPTPSANEWGPRSQ